MIFPSRSLCTRLPGRPNPERQPPGSFVEASSPIGPAPRRRDLRGPARRALSHRPICGLSHVYPQERDRIAGHDAVEDANVIRRLERSVAGGSLVVASGSSRATRGRTH